MWAAWFVEFREKGLGFGMPDGRPKRLLARLVGAGVAALRARTWLFILTKRRWLP